MKISIAFYSEWVLWTIKRAPSIPPEAFALYVTDVTTPFRAVIALLDTLPKGKGLGLVFGVIGWLAQHNNPLLPIRSDMHRIRDRWSRATLPTAPLGGGQ